MKSHQMFTATSIPVKIPLIFMSFSGKNTVIFISCSFALLRSKPPEFLKQEIYSRLILYNFGIFIANEAAEENRKKKRDGSNKYLYEYPSFWHTCFWLFEFKISDIRQQLGYRTKIQTTGLMALPLEYSRLIFSIYFHDNQQLNLLLLLLPSLDMLHSKKFRYKYC